MKGFRQENTTTTTTERDITAIKWQFMNELNNYREND